MAKCPRCKEDMPLLSNICPVCDFVIDGADNGLSAKDFAHQLEGDLYHLKEIPEPTFVQSIMQLSFIVFPLLTLYVLALALISQAGLFFILSLVLGGCSIWVIGKKMKGTLGNDKLNSQFKSLKYKFEYNKRLASYSYGKDKEISALLRDIAGQISEMEQKRKAATTRNVIIWGVIILFFFGLATRGVFSLNKVMNEAPIPEEQEEVI